MSRVFVVGGGAVEGFEDGLSASGVADDFVGFVGPDGPELFVLSPVAQRFLVDVDLFGELFFGFGVGGRRGRWSAIRCTASFWGPGGRGRSVAGHGGHCRR